MADHTEQEDPGTERPLSASGSTDPTPGEIASWPANRALAWLFERYAGQLYHLGLRFCGSPDEAEDLVQEVMLLAFQAWDQYDGRAKPSTWFYTIASRACQRRHRLRSGEPAVMASLDDVLPSRDGYVADLADLSRGDDPFHRQVEREIRDAVESGIAKLPLDFRMPLVLKDIAELSLREIAQITGVPLATTKTRIHRARLRLRKELDHKIEGRPAPAASRAPEVCYDLLKAKLEAMDQGLDQVANEIDAQLCGRCAAVFSGLDAVRVVCSRIGRQPLPPDDRQRIEAHLRARGQPMGFPDGIAPPAAPASNR